jgi:hypothetical protein
MKNKIPPEVEEKTSVRYLIIVFWFYSIISSLMLIRTDLGLIPVIKGMNITIMIGLGIIIFLLDTKIWRNNKW